MYSVVIADDEHKARTYISSLIHYEAMNLFLAGEAENGDVLYRMVEEFSPHIVLIDMKMPGLSGSELIRTLAHLPKAPKIIVISGYDDFTYTKEAINARIAGYLLKPVSQDELNQTLQKVVQELDVEKRARMEELRAIAGNLPVNQTTDGGYNLIERMNSGKLEVQTILPYIPFFPSRTDIALRCCLFRFANLFQVSEEIFQGDFSLLLYAVKNILDELFQKQGVCCVHQGLCEVMVIFFENCQRAPMKAVYNALDVLEKATELKPVAIMGKYCSSLQQLQQSYLRAAYTAAYVDLFARNAIYRQDMDISFPDTAHLWETQLDTALVHGLNVYSRTLIGIYKDFKRYNLTSIFAFNNVWKRAHRDWMRMAEQLENTAFCAESERCFQRIRNSYQPSHIQAHLTRLASSLPQENPYARENVAGQIRAYVDKNYNKNLTVNDLTERFHMSRQHLFRIFKAETGVSPYAYIIDKKIERAKVILLNPAIKVAEIVNLLGFTDESHFNHMFKSKTGMTPRQYRTNCGITEEA